MELLERYKTNRKAIDREQVVAKSQSLYQLREYNGEIWITYDDSLICPSSMMKEDPVKSVDMMRKLFIERTPRL